MVKHLHLEYLFKSPWQTVVQAYQTRFENIPHPLIPALTKVDLYNFSYDKDKKQLKWSMRGYIKPPVPEWLLKLGSITTVPILSHSVLDYSTQVLTNTIENETMRDRITIDEVCTYVVHPDNENWTLYNANSALTLALPTMIRGKAETIVARAYSKQFSNARGIDEEFCEEISSLANPPQFGFLERQCIAGCGISAEDASVWFDRGESGVARDLIEYSEFDATDFDEEKSLTKTSEAASSSQASSDEPESKTDDSRSGRGNSEEADGGGGGGGHSEEAVSGVAAAGLASGVLAADHKEATGDKGVVQDDVKVPDVATRNGDTASSSSLERVKEASRRVSEASEMPTSSTTRGNTENGDHPKGSESTLERNGLKTANDGASGDNQHSTRSSDQRSALLGRKTKSANSRPPVTSNTSAKSHTDSSLASGYASDYLTPHSLATHALRRPRASRSSASSSHNSRDLLAAESIERRPSPQPIINSSSRENDLLSTGGGGGGASTSSSSAAARARGMRAIPIERLSLSARIPEVFDVLVVGAGLSGLTAADSLAEKGYSVCVVDAAKRVGGRTLTVEDTKAGGSIDLGGQWVSPTSHRRLTALARDLGVEIYDQHAEGLEILDSGSGGVKSYSGLIPPMNLWTLLDAQWNLNKIERFAKMVPIDNPHLCKNADEWDGTTAAQWCRKNMWTEGGRQLVNMACILLFGCESREISFLHLLHYSHAAGGFQRLLDVKAGAQEARFVGGSQQVSERLARRFLRRAPDRCTLILNAPVARLKTHKPLVKGQRSRTYVSAYTKAGTYVARRVVVAVPPSLAVRIDYSPPMPVSRDQMAQRVFMGCYTKVVLSYSTAFWRTNGFSGQVVNAYPSPGNPLVSVFDACDAKGEHPKLLGFICGDIGLHMEQLTEPQRRAAVLSSLVRFFGEEATHYTSYHEKQWSQDQWTRGCPVNVFPAGSFARFASVLRVPVGRLHWASTETAREWPGYMEGAVDAGLRVAEEVALILRGEHSGAAAAATEHSRGKSTGSHSASAAAAGKGAADTDSGWRGPWAERPTFPSGGGGALNSLSVSWLHALLFILVVPSIAFFLGTRIRS